MTFWSLQNSLKQTWKQTGGGRSFMRTTAAGGTGNTPPGTGCKPGAVGRETVWSQCQDSQTGMAFAALLYGANNYSPVPFASADYTLLVSDLKSPISVFNSSLPFTRPQTTCTYFHVSLVLSRIYMPLAVHLNKSLKFKYLFRWPAARKASVIQFTTHTG